MLKLMIALASLALLTSIQALAEDSLDVVVVDRQDNASTYTYVVPGYSNSSSNTSANCSAIGSTANCSGQVSTTSTSTTGFSGSYEVQGATLSLMLPDRRIVVVNCASKINWTEWSNPGMYRSCRIPLVNKIQAKFAGDKAKIGWPVSIDGKKMQQETYKIIAILDAQQDE
jgi:hypothetical protein